MQSVRIAREFVATLTKPTPSWVGARLASIVDQSYRYVPFYRELMDSAGVKPGDVRSIRDFMERFPVVNSAEYRNVQQSDGNAALMDRRVDPQSLVMNMSSGSSGIPVRVYRTAADAAHDWARTLSHLIDAGLRPWHRTMAIIQPLVQTGTTSPVQRLGIFRRWTVHPFMDVDEVLDIMRSDRIDAIYGNVDFLVQIADRLQSGKSHRLDVLFPGAGRVDAHTRRYLEDTFRPRRYGEYYGATECGIIASLRHGSYRPDFGSVFFALRDPEPDGDHVRGAILLTSLRASAQPIIQLEIGDSVTVRGYDSHELLKSTIVSIDGRQNDFLVLSDGSRLAGTFFYKLLESFEFVRRFQVIQNQAGQCDVLIAVKDSEPRPVEIVSAALDHHGRGRFDFKVHVVDHIPLQPNGKHKILISRLQSSASHSGEDGR